MSWIDPDSAWQRGMRSRQRFTLISAAMLLLAAFVPIGIVTIVTGNWETVVALFGISVVLLNFAIFLTIRTYRRDARLMRIVPNFDGCVCQKCAIAMERPKPDAQSRDVTCPRCRRSFDEADLKLHWRRYGIAPMGLYQSALGRHSEPTIKNGCIQLTYDLAKRRRGGMVMLAVMTLFWGVWMMLPVFVSGGGLRSVQFYVPVIFIIAGVGAFIGAWKVVDTERRFCTTCGYERTDGTGERCPECACEWREPGGTTAGRVQARHRMLLFGWSMFAIPLMFFLASVTLGDPVQRLTPTSVLIDRVLSNTSEQNALEWNDIAGRSLNEDQRRRLIEGLLNKRLADAGLTFNDAQWLGGQYLAGALPDELVQRLFDEMIDVELVAPESAKVGETIEVTIRTIDRFTSFGVLFPSAIVRGFFVGDDPTPRERQPVALAGILLGDERIERGEPAANHAAHGPRLRLTADGAGTLPVRLELWLLAMPDANSSVFLVEWDENGHPVLPKFRLWTRHVLLECDIEVRD